MKTAARIFTIIGLISAAISLLVVLVGWDMYVTILAETAAKQEGVKLTADILAQIKQMMAVYQIALIMVFLAGIVLGILALVKLSKATAKRQIIPWAVLSIIFVNPLAGIFMLCTKDEDYGVVTYFEPPQNPPTDTDIYNI
jgi:hypothetical protein